MASHVINQLSNSFDTDRQLDLQLKLPSNGSQTLTLTETWSTSVENPQNWSKSKKTFHAAVISWSAFTSAFGSSIYTPAHKSIVEQFSTSNTIASLPFSIYLLGLAFGPSIAAPSCETWGRKAVYLACTPIFALFTLGAGFSNSIASLCICRFLAGVFASPGLTIGSSLLADVYSVPERATPMAAYIASGFIAPAVGPLVGSYAVQEQDWRWTQWILLFAIAISLAMTLSMSETYKKIILKSQMKAQGHEASDQSPPREGDTIRTWVTKTLTRPLHMLATEPIIGLFSLYVALTFAVTYTFFTVTPYVFAEAFDFDLEQQGLTYIGMIISTIVAFLLILVWANKIYRPRVVHWKTNAATKSQPPPPEWRLIPALVASPMLPVALFLFGWTADADGAWIGPTIAMALQGAGTFLVFLSATMYVTDCYGPLYGASAAAGNTILRYIVGATFPLFAIQMFSAMGTGWAASLLGFVYIALGCCPWIFLIYGPRIRKRQKYANSN